MKNKGTEYETVSFEVKNDTFEKMKNIAKNLNVSVDELATNVLNHSISE